MKTKHILVETKKFQLTFNLKLGKYWPYRKPNDRPLYIHQHLNHPPAIKKQLQSMLADRLSLLSYNCQEFTRAIPEYEEAMQRSGHPGGLQYIIPPGSHKRKSRKRNIVWFNPPFSEHVKTNIKRSSFTCSRSTSLPITACTRYAIKITSN